MRTYTRQTLAERFWSKVDPGSPGECWDWRGATTGLPGATHKYGYLGRTPASSLGPFVPAIVASRASWVLHFGPIPDGIHVLHHCDRPICVNPGHLFLGSQTDNNADRHAKGRDGRQKRGARHHRAVLSQEMATAIIERRALGATQVELAAEFGVSQPTVSRVLGGSYSI
jgi:hypothetical protein